MHVHYFRKADQIQVCDQLGSRLLDSQNNPLQFSGLTDAGWASIPPTEARLLLRLEERPRPGIYAIS